MIEMTVARIAEIVGGELADITPEQAAATRKRVYDRLATERIAVVGYHMPFPSVGYVERAGPGSYRWLAHTYQLSL